MSGTSVNNRDLWRHFKALEMKIKLNYIETFVSYRAVNILRLAYKSPVCYINNCPTRCSTKQSIYYYASSLYMFRVSTTPIFRSTQNCNYSLWYCAAASLQHGQAWPRWREVAAHKKIWPVPEAVVTVLCTPEDGCGWHPKHVQWTCRVINRLLCVASRWTIININKDFKCKRKTFKKFVLHAKSWHV